MARSSVWIASVCVFAMFMGGCTALLSGGKRQPAKQAALETRFDRTHCEGESPVVAGLQFSGRSHGY